jgi:hypothetical protein
MATVHTLDRQSQFLSFALILRRTFLAIVGRYRSATFIF